MSERINVPGRINVMVPWLGQEEADAAAEAIASGWVAQGPRVARFEQEFAAAMGARSRAYAEDRFDVNKVNRQLMRVMHIGGVEPQDALDMPAAMSWSAG